MKPRDVSSAMPGTARASSQPQDRFARWLIQQAARHSPPSLSQRLQEEWLADLAAQQGSLSRLRFAVGCCWATTVIAYEHFAPSILATGSGAERAGALAWSPQDVSFFSRRTGIFFLIACLHAVVIFGFASGLAHRVIEVMPPLMKTTILKPARSPELPTVMPVLEPGDLEGTAAKAGQLKGFPIDCSAAQRRDWHRAAAPIFTAIASEGGNPGLGRTRASIPEHR